MISENDLKKWEDKQSGSKIYTIPITQGQFALILIGIGFTLSLIQIFVVNDWKNPIEIILDIFAMLCIGGITIVFGVLGTALLFTYITSHFQFKESCTDD